MIIIIIKSNCVKVKSVSSVHASLFIRSFILLSDQSTSAPGWSTISLGPDGSAMRTDTPPFPTKGTDKQTNLSAHLIQPNTIYGNL